MMLDALKLFAKMFLIITVLLTVFFYLLAIFLGPALFYFTPEGLSTSTLYLPALPVWFLNIPGHIPIGLDFGILFFGLWSIFILSFVAAWKNKKSFTKTVKEAITKPTRKLFSSSLFALPLINSMSLIVIVALQSIQEAGGIPTGSSPTDSNPFLNLVDLSYAAVSEEIGFRLIPIGALLIVYLLVTMNKEATLSFSQKVKLCFLSFLFPDDAKRMVGKKTVRENGIVHGISLSEWGMLVFTSALFGLSHFNPGVSWEIGKITSAGFAGLVLGLSYLVYGAHAPIIVHWFFNAYSETFYLLSDYYPVTTPLANATVILSIILGLFGWSLLVGYGSLKLIRKNKEKEGIKDQTMPSPPVSPL